MCSVYLPRDQPVNENPQSPQAISVQAAFGRKLNCRPLHNLSGIAGRDSRPAAEGFAAPWRHFRRLRQLGPLQSHPKCARQRYRASAAIKGKPMSTEARIIWPSCRPPTLCGQKRSTVGTSASPTRMYASTPRPQVIYRCGDGTLLEVYERPTEREAQHTLASWEVGDLRAAVDQLRNRGVRFEDTTSRGQDRGRHLVHRRPPGGLVSRPRRQHPPHSFPGRDVVAE